MESEANPVIAKIEGVDQGVLRHLLEVEAQAKALVNDAQAEADRRAAEAEKHNRSQYDARYGAEAAALDEQYGAALASIKEEYNKQLDTYRQSLMAMKTDGENFNRTVNRFLGQEG
jgi:vacuolar-type H+-ATPase subunit H